MGSERSEWAFSGGLTPGQRAFPCCDGIFALQTALRGVVISAIAVAEATRSGPESNGQIPD